VKSESFFVGLAKVFSGDCELFIEVRIYFTEVKNLFYRWWEFALWKADLFGERRILLGTK
jgi:hypothetical protein